MLRTVATKIAHNSTIPALAGNSDLRPLQDLITAEKSVLISLQRLSVDIAKASEALRTWGLGEGDDLGDTLSASANVLTHYSSALSQYASHGQRMRDQLKAIRTREEALEDLKRRRRSVMSNADSAERKLSRMSPENKNLGNQQETLNRLRNEIRSLDSDIIAEETALGDFKRTQVKTMMGLKFGGLLECSEKGTVVGEYGKLVIAEIQDEASLSGVPRRVYYGHGRTGDLVADAHRRVSEVVLSTTIPVKDTQMVYTSKGQIKSQEMYDNSPWGQGEGSAKYLSTPQDLANGRFINSSPSPMPFDAPPPHSAHSANYEITNGPKKQSVDDFGIVTWGTSSAGASRFNTYPPKIGPGKDGEDSHTLNDEPFLPQTRQDSNSFSVSVTEALSTIGDGPESNKGVRASVGSTAPPSYASFVEPGLDREISRFSHFSGISEEPGQLAYANEQDDPSHHDQTQYELPAAAGHYRDYGEAEDVDYVAQRAGALEERVSQSYSATDIGGDTPRAHTTFENRYQESLRPEEEERVLDAAAAREIGREMEAMNFARDRRNSLPQSVHSTATDELKTSLPPSGSDGSQSVFVTMSQQLSPLQPPSVPFARQTISPRPSFERLQQTSSQPTSSQPYRTPLIQPRQNFPASYETQAPEFPLPSPTASRFNLPNSPPSPQITSRSPFPSSRGSPEQSPLSTPLMSKVSSTSSLPPGGRTISVAAFKKAIPRKGSEATISERRQLTTGSPSQSQLQSPVIPPGRERVNSDSRPLPTPPQHERDGDYGAGRFVTNLEDEWK